MNYKSDNKNKGKRFDWEDKKEYDYRLKTEKVMQSIKKLLDKVAKVKSEGPLKIENGFDISVEYLKTINVPFMYLDVNKHLIKAIENYSAGFNLLKDSQNKDTKKIVESGVKIRKGNTYLELSKIEIYEAVIKKEQEKRIDLNVKN
jgi:hypothetical protein